MGRRYCFFLRHLSITDAIGASCSCRRPFSGKSNMTTRCIERENRTLFKLNYAAFLRLFRRCETDESGEGKSDVSQHTSKGLHEKQLTRSKCQSSLQRISHLPDEHRCSFYTMKETWSETSLQCIAPLYFSFETNK